ncbi:hypothetical protein J8F10_36580 [Gemmata sp. G18]|uniref:TMEM205-like domain-containing protein n=1 Tax=Gemmata palustris TaxID=2822762 RepID=A0ABS5C5P0_9BACT|nr:DUF4149 domain-containing protein [Gemmata palustris]MBP3960770.1 hypothetical protein [Gemmata palustris]
MTALRRFLVVQLLLLWQGGFLFYTACVVPIGTRVLGSGAAQGAITARVTDVLNVIGAVALAGLALDLIFARDPARRRTVYRWVAWGVALACQVGLFYLHLRLESYMDEERRFVMVLPPFYPTHRVYLWTSTVQWAACLLLTWGTLRAWHAEAGGQK